MALSPCWFVVMAIVAAFVGFIAHDPSHAPSPLLHAAYRGDLVAVKRILPIDDTPPDAHLRAQANARDQWNNSALHWAAKGGTSSSLAIAQHLLTSGTDVGAVNNGGSTALHWACSVPDVAVSIALIRLFVSRGVDASVANGAGETPLHWAVDWSRLHAVDELLHQGAQANAKDVDGNTPMHKVKMDCHEKEDCTSIVSRLLRGGADSGLKNNFNRVPLQYFNQDKEQQTQKQQQELEQRMQREKELAGEAAASTSDADGSSPPSVPAQVSEEQIEQIQKQFAEFKKNMTEGILDQDRRGRQEETAGKKD